MTENERLEDGAQSYQDVSSTNEGKYEESTASGDRNAEELRIAKIHSGSASSAGSATTDADGDERPSLRHVGTPNSIPASIMSHLPSGTDLEKGPSGLKNKTIDENGKVVVNWTSLDDPENPKNWPRKKKIFNVAIISSMTFLCPLCSAMFVSLPIMSFAHLLVARLATDNDRLSNHRNPRCFFSICVSAWLRIWAIATRPNE